MKKLVLVGLCVGLIAADLSGLRKVVIQPTVENISVELAEFKASIKDLELNEEQKAALASLEAATKPTIIESTLYSERNDSPANREKMQDYLEENYDLWESMSYADEDGGLSESCNFDSEEYAEETGDTYFEFESIKRKLDDKIVAYRVYHVGVFQGVDADTGESKQCDYQNDEFFFEAELNEEGEVVEID